MLQVKVNGQTKSFERGATVADAAQALGLDENASGVAIAVNDAVVPRREWSARTLSAGDVVEIIRAVQGG